MPDAAIAKRGGATKVRTVKIGKNRYAHVYVVKKKGPRGGKTVLGGITKKRRSK